MRPDPKGPGVLFARQVIRATERAMERAAVAAHEDLKRGLNPLATVTSIAPFIGILGTAWAFAFDTFVGVGIDRLTGLAVVAEGISRACLPSAFGLIVGLQSLWCYTYFRARLEQFDLDMKGESLRLLNQLTLQLSTASLVGGIDPFNPSVPYLETYHVTSPADRRFRRRSSSAAVALLVAAWCLQVVRDFGYGFLPLGHALPVACRDVLITFGCSWLLTYVVWVGLLHRKSIGLFLAAAVLSLSWCAAELLIPVVRF
jgi:MotA/TolQ/ExbB proton channel family